MVKKQRQRDLKDTVKPVKRSARVERILKKREPQPVEGGKNLLVLRGHKTSQTIKDVLSDFARLAKPNCKPLMKKNDILPFEDVNSIEFLTTKNDCGLFVIGSSTKKRPDNLIIGRIYDEHVLDMFEFGVSEYTQLGAAESKKTKSLGSKPLLVFLGDQWDSDSTFKRVENLLIDLFRGEKVPKLALKGIDHAISCTIEEGKIFVRGYSTGFLKSGTKVPDLELTSMGPNFDLGLRRSQVASEDLWKLSLKQPRGTATAKVKNVSRTGLGEKLGKLHMKKQNLDTMNTRRVTALRNDGKGRGAKPKEKAMETSRSM
jgi:ribosome production factor 2